MPTSDSVAVASLPALAWVGIDRVDLAALRGLCYCVTCVCSAAVRASCPCCGRPCRAANLAALCSLSRRHSTSTALCCGTCTPLRVTFIPTLTHWPYRCIYVCFSERRKHLCMPLRLHSLSQHARWRLTREDAGSVMLSSFPYEDRVQYEVFCPVR